MATTAGAITQQQVSGTTADLTSAAATGGAAPYTYQWYRSTTPGFTPGAGNLLAGQTSLTLHDTGLIPNTQYYWKVVATDNGAVAGTSAQLAGATGQQTVEMNTFGQGLVAGHVDLRYAYNTVSVQIDSSQVGKLYFGAAVKMVDNDGGVPKVIGVSANTDEVLGFINYDAKSQDFEAGDMAEISMEGNVIYLWATTAIPRGARVTLDVTSPAGVGVLVGSSGAKIVGWAYDKATAPGELIRVHLKTPSFAVA